MNWNYREDLPIYPQLVELLKKAIVSGELAPGSRLQSVREMAMDAGVNPNTMQRALADLEQQGLVYTQRTAGRFVTEDAERIKSEGSAQARAATEAYLRSMNEMGYSVEETVKMVAETAKAMPENTKAMPQTAQQ